MSEWISVKERLPEIPKGKYGISVIVAEFDPVYDEINPGRGYTVTAASFCKISDKERKTWGWPEFITEDFMQLYSASNGSEWGPMSDVVTHWMYMPEAPKT